MYMVTKVGGDRGSAFLVYRISDTAVWKAHLQVFVTLVIVITKPNACLHLQKKEKTKDSLGQLMSDILCYNFKPKVLKIAVMLG